MIGIGRKARQRNRKLGRAAKKIIKNTPPVRTTAAGGGIARRKARRLNRAKNKIKSSLPTLPTPTIGPNTVRTPKRTTAYTGGSVRTKLSSGGPVAKPN
jgi:hypothetical protein